MVKSVLKLLLEGEVVSTDEIAGVLGSTEEEVEQALEELQREKVLLGWRPIINPAALAEETVEALIEVSIVPEREGGFNRIAQRIARFEQVATCYLMSGGYDLMVVVRGANLLRVATFVSEKLATLEPVQSTATRFMLRCYKVDGRLIEGESTGNGRLSVTP